MEPEHIMGLDDEYRDHLHSALDHLRFLGKLARRTGLYERIDDVGWSYGGGEYHAYARYGVYGEQAEELGRILEGGDLNVWLTSIDDFTAYADDRSPIVIEAIESELSEEDLIGVIEGEVNLVEAYAYAIARHSKRGFVPERMLTSAEVIEEHPYLAQWVADYYPDDIRSRRAFLLREGTYDEGVIYDWFMTLVDAWEVIHEKRGGRTQDGDEGASGGAEHREDSAGANTEEATQAHGNRRPGRADEPVREPG